MLTSKQRAHLRAMANGLDPIFQIGKDGVTDNLICGVDEALEKRELVKISILENSPAQVRESMDLMVTRLGAEPVQCIGRRFALYRESEKFKRIEL